MQKINIDNIIKKLKTTLYWRNYIKAIKEVIDEKELEFYIGKKGVLEVGKEKISNYPDDWTWNKFDNLKKEFINLIFEEIDYCPNCGKSPFISTGKLNLKSFDLDHFFPKSKFNYLMFNFYNLIPICPFCNQKIKRDRNPFDYEGKLFHPYFGILEITKSKITFTNDFNIDKCLNFYNYYGFLRSNINQGFTIFNKINDIYHNSNDTKNIFNFIQDKIYKIKDEEKRLPLKGIKENWRNYFFKNYYPLSEQDILKFSNGKLKKDLIENLKI